jgi:hypothetical protein
MSNLIISVGVNGWYPRGIDLLKESLLKFHDGEVLLFKDYPPNSLTHEELPYYLKISAFEYALEKGYKKILWLDASFTAHKSTDKIFEFIEQNGYFFFCTGYNLAQSINDNALNYVGLSRDDAEKYMEFASGCVGIDFENEKGIEIYKLWKHYMDCGLSLGSRNHDNQSLDERFLFHRQDQSCLNLATQKLNLNHLKSEEHFYENDYVEYYNHQSNYKDSFIFLIHGNA